MAISSFCALMMREVSRSTDGPAPWVGAHADITSACAWCRIIPDMKATSAGLTVMAALSMRAR